MRILVLSVTAILAFAGVAFGQTSHTGANIPEVLRGKSAEPTTNNKETAPTKPAVHKVAAAQSTQRPAAQHSTPQRWVAPRVPASRSPIATTRRPACS